jgi:hypothetical protein
MIKKGIIIMFLVCASVMLVLSGLDIEAALAQEERQEGKLPEPPSIVPPPLPKYPARADVKKLPKGFQMRAPTYDGHKFLVTAKLPEKISEESLIKTINTLLPALGFTRSSKEIVFVEKFAQKTAQVEALKEKLKAALEHAEKKIQKEFGQVGSGAREHLKKIEEDIQASGSLQAYIYVFEQKINGVPIDNTGIQVTQRGEEAPVSFSGRLFNQIKIDNKPKLSPKEAIRKSSEQFQKITKSKDGILSEPILVILPYGEVFKYTFRMIRGTEEMPYYVHVDAENGKILQLIPLFSTVDAKGAVFEFNPDGDVETWSFEIDPASGGNYSLNLTGSLICYNEGADGQGSAELTIPSSTAPPDYFDTSPYNNTTNVDDANGTNYNTHFQQINAYAWVSNLLTWNEILGGENFGEIDIYVNDPNVFGWGMDNAGASYSSLVLQFGIGSATANNNPNGLFNTALDGTMFCHEFGHLVHHNQVHAGASVGTQIQPFKEGFADYWAATYCSTNLIAEWCAQNWTESEAGGLPRRLNTNDVFPDHRHTFGGGGYADGQIQAFALWNCRQGVAQHCASEGLARLNFDANLLDALVNYGDGLSYSSATDEQLHDHFYDLLENITTVYSGLSSNGTYNKVAAGFARTGLFLASPDAVVDIADDFLDRNDATGPAFAIWTGRDYGFDSSGNADGTLANFNQEYRVIVANDASFSVNVRDSGWQGGVVDGHATYTLLAADWNAIKGGDRLYYKVETRQTGGGSLQNSLDPGGVFTNFDPPYAIINETGDCECTCTPASAASGGYKVAWVMLIPIALGLFWRRRLKKKRRL